MISFTKTNPYYIFEKVMSNEKYLKL